MGRDNRGNIQAHCQPHTVYNLSRNEREIRMSLVEKKEALASKKSFQNRVCNDGGGFKLRLIGWGEKLRERKEGDDKKTTTRIFF